MVDTKNTKQDKINNDGWANLFTGLGIANKDRASANQYGLSKVLTQNELDNIYRGDGFGKTIIDSVTKAMTREWFKVEGDNDNKILDYLNKIDAKKEITKLIRWSRLYGGAIMVIGADDGNEDSAPLNFNTLKSISYLRVHDRYSIQIDSDSFYTDIRNPKYGQVQFYKIQPLFGFSSNFDSYTVHESRVIRMDGEDLPDRLLIQNQYWGDSVLNSVYNQLANLGSAYQYTSNVLADFVQSILTIKNLADLIASGKEQLIQNRLEILNYSRSALNMMLIGEGEQYNKMTTNVAGLSDLIDKFVLALSAVSRVPEVILMGRSPTGLNATGDTDIRNFYDEIKGEQEDVLKPKLDYLIELILSAQDSPFKKSPPKNWKIKFNPLWQMDETQIVDMRNKQSQTDLNYINGNVLDPDEVAISRFGGDAYSIETTLMTDRTTEQDNETDDENLVNQEPETGQEKENNAKQPTPIS